MVTSLISNSSYSFGTFALKSNAATQEQAVSRIASGSVSSSGRNPLQADSVSLKIKSAAAMTTNVVSNIGSALSFLDAQVNSLNHMSALLSKMGEITSAMQDPLKSSEDLSNYMREFKSLRLQLTTERNATYGDQSLHDKFGSSSSYSVQINAEGTQSVSFTQSNFISNGGGAWDTLIGTDAIDLTVTDGTVTTTGTGTTAPTDKAVFGNNTSAVSQETASLPKTSSDAVEISGEQIGTEGYGTKDRTVEPKDIINNAVWGLTAFDSLLQGVATMIASNTAQQSSLRRGLESVNSRTSSLSALNGSITEADVAHEVTSLAKTQLLTQSASSAFAQTNVSAEGVVKALWGEISSGIDWYQPEIQKSILPKIAFA